MAETNLSELIRQTYDSRPILARSPTRMSEYLTELTGQKVSVDLVKQVVKNLKKGKGPGVKQTEPPADDPLYVPQAVRDAVPRHDGDEVWANYESAIEEAGFEMASTLAMRLGTWDRIFLGMLVDEDCHAAELLRVRVKNALLNRLDGQPYPDERIMADWVKEVDEVFSLGFKEFLDANGIL